MKNILSVDVESWVHFYIDALKKDTASYTTDRKKAMDDGYCIEAVTRLLELFRRYQCRATFFVVGEIYEWYPELIRAIALAGHEVGYHTHEHAILTDARILTGELRKSRRFLDEYKPIGFRAPQIYLTEDAYAYLPPNGFCYSSSTYDTRGRYPRVHACDEIPVSTLAFRAAPSYNEPFPRNLTFRLLRSRIPCGSGLWLALSGARGMGYCINRLNRAGRPANIFFHPWQLYQPPAIRNLSFMRRVAIKNPLCLPYMRNVAPAVEILLKKYSFVSFKDYYYG